MAQQLQSLADMREALAALAMMRDDGLLEDAEYQQLKQENLQKYRDDLRGVTRRTQQITQAHCTAIASGKVVS